MVANHFLESRAADGYDTFRPYFHPLVFGRLSELTSHRRFDQALDVACGTGQSSVAMAATGTTVVGLDASAAMLRHARRRGIACVQASAESLPYADRCVDLVAVGLAFHWFDQPAFLREARRVLRPDGVLLTYNSWFAGIMDGSTAFPEWYLEYLQRYPAPPRHAAPLASEVVRACGFREVASERFSHEHPFTRDAFVGYLKTQSNVTAAIERGATTEEHVTRWLLDTLEPLFSDPRATFRYDGALTVYAGIDGSPGRPSASVE